MQGYRKVCYTPSGEWREVPDEEQPRITERFFWVRSCEGQAYIQFLVSYRIRVDAAMHDLAKERDRAESR